MELFKYLNTCSVEHRHNDTDVSMQLTSVTSHHVNGYNVHLLVTFISN